MAKPSLKAKLSDSDFLRANENIPFAKWDYENTIKYAEVQAEARGAHEKAVAITRKMKKEGVPISQIRKFTGLSEEEIEKL